MRKPTKRRDRRALSHSSDFHSNSVGAHREPDSIRVKISNANSADSFPTAVDAPAGPEAAWKESRHVYDRSNNGPFVTQIKNQSRFRRVVDTANIAARNSNKADDGSGTAEAEARGPCS